jgi:hypothetical protein
MEELKVIIYGIFLTWVIVNRKGSAEDHTYTNYRSDSDERGERRK